MKNGLLDESKGIQDHKELTDIWQQGGIVEGQEYAILTNEIYKEWSGMTAKRIQRITGLRKESLRDNMEYGSHIDGFIGGNKFKRLAQKHRPKGLEQK